MTNPSLLLETTSASALDDSGCIVNSGSPPRYRFWVVGFTVLAALLSALMLNPTMTVVNHDAAIFALLGQALARGEGYLLHSTPVAQPYFTFPPGLPLQIAGLMKIFGTTEIPPVLQSLKAWVSLLFVASIPLFFAWCKTVTTPKRALILTGLLSVSPLMYEYSSDLLSDVAYWGWSMVAIYAHQRWLKTDPSMGLSPRPTGFKLGWLALFLGCTLVTVLTRQIGMALALALMVHSFWVLGKTQKRWFTAAALSLFCLISMVAWPLYEHQYRSTHTIHLDTLNQADVDKILAKSPVKLEYVKHFLVENPVSQDTSRVMSGPADYLNLIQQRVLQYSKATVDQLLPPLRVRLNGEKENLSHTVWPLVLGLVVAGFAVLIQRNLLIGAYLLLYLGVLAIYPYYSPRFAVPVMPFIMLMVFLGASATGQWLNAKLKQPLNKTFITALTVTGLGVVLIGGHLPETVRWVKAGYRLKIANAETPDFGPSLRPHNKAYYESLRWAKTNLPSSSLLISRKPPVAYYYAGHPSVGFLFTQDHARFFQFMADKRQRYAKNFPHCYVIEDGAFSESKKLLTPVIEAHPNQFKQIYQHPTHPETRIWQFQG